MFGLAAAIIASNKGRPVLAWISGLWAAAAIAIGILCRLPLVVIPSLLLLVLALSLPDKSQDGKPAIYYCRSCGFTGYQKTKNFELCCPKCKAPLMKTDTTRETWNKLSQEEKKDLQAKWSGKAVSFSDEYSAVSAPVDHFTISYPDLPEKASETALKPVTDVSFRPVSPSANVSSLSVSYCRRCGKRIPEGSRFCQYCGLRI